VLAGRIGDRTGFDDGVKADDRNAVLFHHEQGQAILENNLFVRRQLQCLRRRGETKNNHEGGGEKKFGETECDSHCFAFSSFSGISVATVRLFAPKYFSATRWTSAFVTAL